MVSAPSAPIEVPIGASTGTSDLCASAGASRWKCQHWFWGVRDECPPRRRNQIGVHLEPKVSSAGRTQNRVPTRALLCYQPHMHLLYFDETKYDETLSPFFFIGGLILRDADLQSHPDSTELFRHQHPHPAPCRRGRRRPGRSRLRPALRLISPRECWGRLCS